MTDHNGVLMMQRLLLAGALGLAVAQKAAAILDGEPAQGPVPAEEAQGPVPAEEAQGPAPAEPAQGPAPAEPAQGPGLQALPAGPDPRSQDGAVLRVILDAANECLGHFDDRPSGERWCDALLHLLDLAAFAADLGSVT